MTYSPALPAAIGYTVKSDDSAGYGVTRMLVSRQLLGQVDHVQVWNPRDDSAQCFEVLCWLMAQDDANYLDRFGTRFWISSDDGCLFSNASDNTPASLRAAIVEAAERVAQS